MVKATPMNTDETKQGCKMKPLETYVEILQYLKAAKHRYSPRLLLEQHFSFALEGALPYLETNVNALPKE